MAALAAVALAGIVATVNQNAYGTALSADRSTPEMAGKNISILAASNTFYAGAMLCENGSATAVPAADASGYVCIGKNRTYLDNTGANYSATARVEAQRGVFRWVNGGSFTDANIGDLAYVEDDQTVTTAASATYDVIAGVIVDVDASGVWVDTYAIGGSGAASVTTLAASGAATLGSTLSVAGAATLTGNGIANELDARTATSLLIGKATATSVTFGASDAPTIIAGTLTAPAKTVVAEATTSRVCTAADYGKLLIISSNAAVAITLPANGATAGSQIDFMIAGTDDCAPTVSAATADTLIGPNDVDLDSVTYGTGHRIGAYLRVVSDGTYWHAINLGTTTMSGND